MIVNAIVQARLGSTRLPGKVMLEAAGKPLIGHLIDRLKLCKNIDRVVVAIPLCDLDTTLNRYLFSRPDCDVYCGNEENDLCARFLAAIAAYPCDAFVRVCGDSPMIEPELVDSVVDHLKSGMEFFSTAGWKMLPAGQSVEGCSVKSYREVCEACALEDREHAGFPWVYRRSRPRAALVDTPEDFARVKAMIERA